MIHSTENKAIKEGTTSVNRGTQQRFPPKCIETTFFKNYPQKYSESTFRSLEIHSKRHNKIYICSVILGELESFGNYQGFRIVFSKIIDSI